MRRKARDWKNNLTKFSKQNTEQVIDFFKAGSNVCSDYSSPWLLLSLGFPGFSKGGKPSKR